MNEEKANKARRKAEDLFSNGKYEKALDMVIKSLELNPRDPGSWQLQGIIQQALGLNRDAITSYQQAIKLDNKAELSYTNLCKLWRNKRDYFKEMNVLRELVNINPKSELLRNEILGVLGGNVAKEIEELFKIQPEILIKIINNTEDDEDYKYQITSMLKNVATSFPELFAGKAFNVIKELVKSKDDEIRSTGYLLMIAAYEANPRTIESLGLDLIRKGLKDSNLYIRKSCGGLLKSMLNYFPNYLTGNEDIIESALEKPEVAPIIIKIIPPCPKCKTLDEVYLKKNQGNEKLLRLYCKNCNVDYYKPPGSVSAKIIEKKSQELKGPIICPLCKKQFLKWIEGDNLYKCSICNKYFTT
ncbi:MAG: tetratricopeptide repeat protein [Promethearchaeota archaeon]